MKEKNFFVFYLMMLLASLGVLALAVYLLFTMHPHFSMLAGSVFSLITAGWCLEQLLGIYN
jgi:hypothetical protein